jgi:hypothetical protein
MWGTGEARAWACVSSERYELRTFTVRSIRNGYLYTTGGCLRTRGTVSAKRAFADDPGYHDHTGQLPCAYLLDHLVRLEEEHRGKREAQFLRRLEVDDEMELHDLLDG